MSRDETGPPLGALPVHEHTGDTDPDVFQGIDAEATKRRCLNCGAEIGPDESATLRGEIRAYEKVHAFLVAQHVSPAAAARTVEAIRKS